MLDEREAAAAGFFFPEVPLQSQHPHQEEAYHNAIQALLFHAPPAGDFRGIFSNQSFIPPISSIPNVQVNSQKPACLVRGCK